MKKILLFGLSLGLAFGLNAQNIGQMQNTLRVADGQEAQVEVNHPKPVLNANPTKADVNRIVVGTATGQRGFRREEAKLVSYVPELDIITVTFVPEPGTYPGIDDDGTVVQFYSSDQGINWTGPIVLNNEDENGLNYYYSGSTYNPTGNTEITSAYGVHQGTIIPAVDPNGPWAWMQYGSSTLGGENQTNYMFEESNIDDYPMGGYFNILGLGQGKRRNALFKYSSNWNME